jgi:hypothetical protein
VPALDDFGVASVGVLPSSSHCVGTANSTNIHLAWLVCDEPVGSIYDPELHLPGLLKDAARWRLE